MTAMLRSGGLVGLLPFVSSMRRRSLTLVSRVLTIFATPISVISVRNP